MSSSCGTVSLDRYWSYIGTPLFFTTIAVGVFTLFQVQDIQLMDSAKIKETVQQLRDAKKGGTGSPADVANPAVPSPLNRVSEQTSKLLSRLKGICNKQAAAPAALSLGRPHSFPRATNNNPPIRI